MFCLFIKKGIVSLFSELVHELSQVDKNLCHTWATGQKEGGERGERKESVSTEVWMSQPTGPPGLILTTWDSQGDLEYSRG
jgi:hypothetical protein